MAKLTPVQLSKRWSIRPQMIFNWVRQGCPSYQIGGKTYVDDKEVDEWREERQVAKKQRQKATTEKRSQQDKVGREASDALGKFRPQRVKHLCPNCGKGTEFLCDLMYVGEPIDNYITAYCIECRLSHRISKGEISNEEMLGILLEGKSLWVPCYDPDCSCEKREVILPKFETSNEPDPEDVKPYKPNREDRASVLNDQKVLT
jgi:hypothetical protein